MIIASCADDVVMGYAEEVRDTMKKLSAFTAKRFGYIEHGNMRTTTATGYINVCASVALQRAQVDPSEARMLHYVDYYTQPTLCHNALDPEHIIVNGHNVVGMIGWFHADYVPEVYNRLRHYYRGYDDKTSLWYGRISSLRLSSPDLYDVTLGEHAARFAYAIARKDTEHTNQDRLAQLHDGVIRDLHSRRRLIDDTAVANVLHTSDPMSDIIDQIESMITT